MAGATEDQVAEPFPSPAPTTVAVCVFPTLLFASLQGIEKKKTKNITEILIVKITSSWKQLEERNQELVHLAVQSVNLLD